MTATRLAGRVGATALWALLCSGCVTTNTGVVDKMPKGAPKGFVEFYATNGNTLGKRVSVSKLRRNEVDNYGQFTGVRRLRVACPPGQNYLFLKIGRDMTSNARSPLSKLTVSLAANGRQVDAPVREGMVTPVRLTFTEVSRDRNFVNFRWEVALESPQALSNNPELDEAK